MSDPRTLKILILAHDLSDAAIKKRAVMLREGGATVTIAGFRRTAEPIRDIAGMLAIDFGQTYSAGFLQRIWSVIREAFLLKRHRRFFQNTDVVIARNLEMLALGVRGRSLCAHPPVLVYECLDIHRLLLNRGPTGILLRALEAWLARRASALITSSPAFVSEYFEKISGVRLPTRLIENKILKLDDAPSPASGTKPDTPPWVIGWFGIIRCRKSLQILTSLVKESNGAVEVVIRGRPALHEFDNFHKLTSEVPGLRFLGPYKSPDDLAAIYQGVHFTWAIDMFEEGLNSSWLLPNRLYEGGFYGSVPIAIESVETGRFLKNSGAGITLNLPLEKTLVSFFNNLNNADYMQLENAIIRLPIKTWVYEREDYKALVSYFSSLCVKSPEPASMVESASSLYSDRNGKNSVLVVIPCLNEEKYIENLVHNLVASNQNLPVRIVIADGESADRTPEIGQRLAREFPNVLYMKNPKRLQSAAINLAVATFGEDARFLIRIDAHAGYPANYCQALVEEAEETKAASIVVSMKTEGKERFQRAVAAAQNSKLGNGGSMHRNTSERGRWVDHGHHALMRIDAFRQIGGYDETFTHNEDAEFDTRLGKAGFKIWLTGETALTYYPRSSPLPLFRQYIQYGYGRARNIMKHRTIPKIRQMAPAAVLPALLLALATPVFPLAAFPLVAWAFLCLGYGMSIGVKTGDSNAVLIGPAAMIMHFGWSIGFWNGILQKLLLRLP